MNGAAQAPVVVPLHAGTAASPVRRSLDLPDLIARAVIVTLFTMMTMRLGANFLETGRITGLLLVASELLVVVLTVARRRARTLDRTVRARLLTAMSMAGPPLVYPVVTGALAPETLTAGVSAVGLAIVIGGQPRHRLGRPLPARSPPDLPRIPHHARRVPGGTSAPVERRAAGPRRHGAGSPCHP